jgi:hypothetical protein
MRAVKEIVTGFGIFSLNILLLGMIWTQPKVTAKK